MKTLLTITLLVAGLTAYGAERMNALPIGPFCMSFSGVCDRKEISINSSGIVYGLWDYTCTGSPLAAGLGTYSFPNATFSTIVPEYGGTFIDRFNIPARTWELWFFDGVNPPHVVGSGTWTVKMEPCGFSETSCDDCSSILESFHPQVD